MKGSRGILALVTVAVLLATIPAWSQDEYAIPVSRTIAPGRTQIKFDGITYNFSTQGNFSVLFEDLDAIHVKLTLKPIKPETAPYPVVYVQWESFGPVSLGVTAPEGAGYVLNTETGYAEK